MGLVPRCVKCDSPLDAYGREGAECSRCKPSEPTLIERLRECPFCGGAAVLENYIIEAAVYCAGCFARTKASHAPTEDTGIAKAIAAWNTRAADALERAAPAKVLYESGGVAGSLVERAPLGPVGDGEALLRNLVRDLETWPDEMLTLLRRTDEARKLVAALTPTQETSKR